MAVWRLQVNTGGTNVADYCLKNHVAAMGWSLRELTQAERSGIHTFWITVIWQELSTIHSTVYAAW